MKKKLVTVGEYFPPRLGGGCRLFEIMKRLSHKHDIHFIIVPPAYVSFIRKIEFDVEEEKQIFCENMIGHRIRLPRTILKLWRRELLLSYTLTMVWLFFGVLKKLVELKPDIVIIDAPSPYSGLLGVVCGRILRKKLLIEYNDIQALYTIEMLENKPNIFVKNALILIEDKIVQSGWRVTAISNFIGKYASTRGRRDIIVIPNGVNLQMFNPEVEGKEIRNKYDVDDDTKLCVYTGRIEKCVGAEVILETAELLQKRKDIQFMIVGEGDLRIIKSLSELRNVVLTGLVPKEDVPKYLAAGNIIIVPFSNSIASHGISPLKLFEALAMEKPVITSAVSGVKEVIINNTNGILVLNNPQEWVYAINDLISNPVKATFLGKNARKTAQKYSWNCIAEKFNRIIDSCA